jgi:DNA mismatch repair protein MutH
MLIPPPQSEQELISRANHIAGKTLAEVASFCRETMPPNLKRAKGWAGQLIEKALGANAFNLDKPDFMELGIELKTLPLSPNGQVLGSTYICTAPIPNIDFEWEQSRVWRKMAKMIFVPIEADDHKPLALQRIGCAIFWSPSMSIAKQLQQDWEELTELITLGQFEQLSAERGKYLQIRPKAANAKTFIQAINADGHTLSIVPKGFYLRTRLTQQIVNEHYALL